MSSAQAHIRHGFGAVRPYLYGDADLPNFVREVFGAEELERTVHRHGGCNVEIRIGDSIVVIESGPHPTGEKTRASVYVYVEDTDAAYDRAQRLGATSVAEPQDKPWGDRLAGMQDSFGNVWWIATQRRICV